MTRIKKNLSAESVLTILGEEIAIWKKSGDPVAAGALGCALGRIIQDNQPTSGKGLIINYPDWLIVPKGRKVKGRK